MCKESLNIRWEEIKLVSQIKNRTSHRLIFIMSKMILILLSTRSTTMLDMPRLELVRQEGLINIGVYMKRLKYRVLALTLFILISQDKKR